MERDFRELLLRAAGLMGIPLTVGQITLFEVYRETLFLWNGKMNLVSLQSDLDLPVRHFIDSLTVLPYLPAGPITLLDIGSGAGFPAIPVKVLRKDLHVTLLEAARKKSSFLKEVIRKLDLQDISVLNCRLEELLAGDRRQCFDVIVSRATFKLADLVEMSLPLLKKGGVLAAMKGPGLEEEMVALGTLNNKEFRIVGNHALSLPLTGDRRHILLVDKPL
jgi:16S rRNA (guanine527-N7)-methyltransferase